MAESVTRNAQIALNTDLSQFFLPGKRRQEDDVQQLYCRLNIT